MANRIKQWLLTFISSHGLKEKKKKPHLLSLQRCEPSCFRVFLSRPGVLLAGLKRSRLVGGEKGKQLWGFQDGGAVSQEEKRVAGCQSQEHTEPCLEAWACTQHRCWKRLVEGIQRGGGKAYQEKTADWVDQYKSGVCVGRKVACHCEMKGGGNRQQSAPI